MSDKDLPDIPSFEELGFSPDEVEQLERELAEGEGPGPLTEAGPPAGAAPAPGDAASKAKTAPAAGAGAPPSAKPPEAPAREPEAAPGGKLRGPLTLLVLAALVWLSSLARVAPDPAGANAPATAFSAARAAQHLERIARRAHPPGSPEHAAVRSYLLDELEDLGHEPSVQTATSVIGFGDMARAATVRNIVARVPGTASQGAVLITAHYDGRGISRAAGDDGAGVATILEALRALRAGPRPRNDVIVLFTDAEELGLLGARAFVDEHPWLDDVALVLSIEMRGGAGPSFMFETGADNGWVVRAFDQAVARPAANSLSYEVYKRLPNDTDFTPFKSAGKQGLNFAAIGGAHVYHQAYDVPATVSPATLQHHGDQALALLRHLGNSDLTVVNDADASYVSLPLIGLVAYSRLWIWALGILSLLVWAAAVWRVRKRGGRAWGMAAGVGVGAGTIAASGAVAYGLFMWRRGAHPEYGSLHAAAFHAEGWYLLAFAALAFVVGLGFLRLARRWYSASEVYAGALLVPVAGAAAATALIPMGAANLQWPALAGGVALLLGADASAGGKLGPFRWALALAAAAVMTVLLVPLTETLWLAMSLAAAPALGALLGLTVVMLIPALEGLRGPNRWWAPAVGAGLGALFLVLGIRTASPSPERPAPSTLVYLLDRDSLVARWGTDADRPASDPGVAWAAQKVGPVGEPESLSGYALSEVTYAVAPAPAVDDVPPPEISASVDSAAAGLVRVSVRSTVGAEALVFTLGSTGPALQSVNGEPLPNERAVERLAHWGTPENAVELEFARGFRDTSLEFYVAEHVLRPGELVGDEYFERPDHLAPDITRASDRAMLRTRARIDLESGLVTLGDEPVAESAADDGAVEATPAPAEAEQPPPDDADPAQ
ncbi:MAG: M20/M25/M40 family metallo-hydrolase [Gemmatimonadota bacterium]